ncbi:LOW QUALITY PROTEIN: signal-induced proliferation-associated 1-like protein 2 [Mobula birostris]|uniref:LOW QUALITY PROTEIN: signal-induced proliferation-associated 1-like protein 2 n=1 Tax=Mobula birostris TaxID=1983395 RepID=UPI003B27CB2A
MQSDDFFFRKFKRSSPRPPLTSVNFEPRLARPAPEPAGTTVRARILEWPPQREAMEDGGRGSPQLATEPVVRHLQQQQQQHLREPDEGVEGGDEAVAGHGDAPALQRSNSEAAIVEGGCAPPGHPPGGGALHREYGSASSIERSQGGRGGGEVVEGGGDEGEGSGPGLESVSAPRFQDPYLLLGLPESPGGEGCQAERDPFLACRRFRTQKSEVECPRSPPVAASAGQEDARGPWHRAHSLAHFDVQSILFDLRQAASSRDSAGRRKNIATGASAASQLPAAQPAGQGAAGDRGHGHGAPLVLSCPHFRNEVGGEGEPRRSCQCPNAAVSVLEEPRRSYLIRPGSYFIEHADLGANYYRIYFHRKEHQNFFGTDDALGPVAISLRREDKEKDTGSGSQYNYRIIVRTTELRTLRASILEEAFPSSARHGTQRSVPTKKLLEYLVPGLNTHCLRLASNSPKVPEMLLKLDEQGLTFQRKVGVMYCKAGQSTEEEMYNNEASGPAFDEFLDLLGQRVKLKGFEKYRAQLDNKTDSTGTHSLYTTYQEYEIMFHVSTMLPYTANNSQQLLRKRHIGNDIVTIVFQEAGADPFTPKTIRSHFQHVFIVVQVHNPCTEQVSYSVAVTCSKDIPEFGPFFQEGAVFPKSSTFREFLLAKVVNAENAAEKSEKFHAMAIRTRQEYLKDLADNYVTTATVDSSSSKLASIISLPTKKKERPRGSRAPELHSAGALVWIVTAHWVHSLDDTECILGISNEFVVLLDQKLQRVVLNCSCRDVIGWTLTGGSIIIYYEQGEYVAVRTQESQPDDLTEIVHRLESFPVFPRSKERSPSSPNLFSRGMLANPGSALVNLRCTLSEASSSRRPEPNVVPERGLTRAREMGKPLALGFRGSSEVSTCFKPASVIPVPKKNVVTRLSDDFRPGELASTVVKCFERLVMKHANSRLRSDLDPLRRPQSAATSPPRSPAAQVHQEAVAPLLPSCYACVVKQSASAVFQLAADADVRCAKEHLRTHDMSTLKRKTVDTLSVGPRNEVAAEPATRNSNSDPEFWERPPRTRVHVSGGSAGGPPDGASRLASCRPGLLGRVRPYLCCSLWFRRLRTGAEEAVTHCDIAQSQRAVDYTSQSDQGFGTMKRETEAEPVYRKAGARCGQDSRRQSWCRRRRRGGRFGEESSRKGFDARPPNPGVGLHRPVRRADLVRPRTGCAGVRRRTGWCELVVLAALAGCPPPPACPRPVSVVDAKRHISLQICRWDPCIVEDVLSGCNSPPPRSDKHFCHIFYNERQKMKGTAFRVPRRQVAALPPPFSGTALEETGPGYPGTCDPALVDPQQAPRSDASVIYSLAGPSQNPPGGDKMHDTSDTSNFQWQSLADIASYCEKLVQSLSLDEEMTSEEARADGALEPKDESQSSSSPTVLNEKVFHLETIVKQLHDKLRKEKEDKALLASEVEQLRQTNQRLHQESQTTVCHLLRVTELLMHNAHQKPPNVHN